MRRMYSRRAGTPCGRRKHYCETPSPFQGVGWSQRVSDSTRRQADLLLALSRLTLPHELARVILSEQIYRAFTMLRHHPYAR